ncbi:hypothetical protein E4U09_003364 [Claviceps aff. purpurea]|uniref:Uncharacterized protein n=1 Tax=Claviceps aff. purpurea TaxID=1967640 RepID=A0A9P7U205_9HYPO|nr:hypothetical protein E4U09_003364 [Claviceps aff. purpurea]
MVLEAELEVLLFDPYDPTTGNKSSDHSSRERDLHRREIDNQRQHVPRDLQQVRSLRRDDLVEGSGRAILQVPLLVRPIPAPQQRRLDSRLCRRRQAEDADRQLDDAMKASPSPMDAMKASPSPVDAMKASPSPVDAMKASPSPMYAMKASPSPMYA